MLCDLFLVLCFYQEGIDGFESDESFLFHDGVENVLSVVVVVYLLDQSQGLQYD